MLEARSLTKCYSSVPALDNVSFTVSPGQVLGYLGPNGSGKSTTVKIITGLLEPSSGSVLFNQRNIGNDLAAFKRLVGYVPEEANLYPFLSGLEYLELVGRLRGLPDHVISRRAETLLEVFSMKPHRHTAISTYSKGMRQRILLISALLHNPELIIFDEPLSGLDVTSAMIFRKMVAALSRQGKTIFYCSHVLEVVEKVCSHVIILQKGKQLAYGSVEDLKKFQSMPSLEAAFSHLVQEQDAESSAQAIVEAVSR
ncbi:MAG TPA: ABC transporter ATP-binding protein [Bryobacteraceae bacterium]|nr:ABC transporter ATP-binding protein [Bryobacteraceae bacterium]